MARLDKLTVTIEVDITFETDAAYQVLNKKNKRVWVPKSQVELHEEGMHTEMEMPTWLAEDKDLV